MKKQRKGFHAMRSPAQVANRAAIKEVITEELESAQSLGQQQGYMTAMESVHKAIYAAVVITLKDELKFGRQRTEKFMRAVDGVVWNCINSDELVEEALKKTGIEIDLDEVYAEDRVKAAWDEVRKNG